MCFDVVRFYQVSLLCRLQSAMLDLASLEPEVAGVCAAGEALASEATEAAHAATMRTAVQLLKDKLDDVKATSQHKQVLLQVRALIVRMLVAILTQLLLH